MDIGLVTELITSLGLPVALVVAMGWFIFKLWKESVTREERLMGEITENRKVNAEAIQTIALYAERLTHIETDITDIKGDVTVIKQNLNQ